MQLAPKPVQYAVCESTDALELANQVNRKLSQGFQPHGDLHVITTEMATTYRQAVVKVEFRPVELPADLGAGLLVPQAPRIIP